MATNGSVSKPAGHSVPKPEVLVVGAGTTGLYLALALYRNGITPRVIDKLPSPGIGQRGAGIWPRTQELIESFGLLDQISRKAITPMRGRLHKLGSMDATMPDFQMFPELQSRPDAPYVNPILFGQNAHQTFLSTVFPQIGLKLEREVELVSLEQGKDAVQVKLRHTSTDVIEEASFKYVVGCDGAKGAVRKQIGLGFKGESRVQRFVIGDLKLPNDFPPGAWHIWGSMADVSIMLRSTECQGTYALIVGGARFTEYPEIFESNDTLKKFLAKMTGNDTFEKAEVPFSSQYNVNIRMTDTFRSGSVFLAGDACHVHTPAGGQGLNGGIQDACNLGWKLALAVKGLARPALLDSYNAERLPVIATLLQVTTGLWNAATNDMEKAMSSLNRRPELNQLGINYRRSGVVLDDEIDEVEGAKDVSPYGDDQNGRIFAGDRAPDAPDLKDVGKGGEGVRMFKIFDPSLHTVLVFNPDQATALVPTLDAVARKLSAELVQFVIVFRGATAQQFSAYRRGWTVIEDSKGQAYRGYQIESNRPKVFVIRPDGYIGARAASAGLCEKYFNAILEGSQPRSHL